MNKNNVCKIYKIIKIILWLLPFLVFIWILDKHFVLSGKLEIKYKVEKSSKLVKNFASKESDKLIGTKNKQGDKDYFQLITKSPIYFDVKVPRAFQKATVTLKYQNPDSQPVIKLGIQQASNAFYYVDMAFAYPVLDNLPDYWDKIQEGNLILWEKNKKYFEEKKSKQEEFDKKKNELDKWQADELKKLDDEYIKYIKVNKENKNVNIEDNLDEIKKEEYEMKKQTILDNYQEKLDKITKENHVMERAEPEYSSIKDFLNNLPETKKIVQYNYNLANYLEIPYYQKNYKTIEIDKSLRGKHEIHTYIGKGEDLNFTFTVLDINRRNGADIFKVTVFNNKEEKVKEFSLPDDGEEKASNKVYPERTLQILMENIPHGIYHLIVDASDPTEDLFINKIVTFQHLVMFKNYIFLAENEEYKSILGDKILVPTTLFTNSTNISASVPHEINFQELDIFYNKKKEHLKIDVLKTPKTFSGLKGTTSITSPKNDVLVSGDGFLTFSENQLFDPNFGSVNQLDNITNVEDYDYIIANYLQAKQDGDWLEASSIVNTQNLYFHKDNNYTANFIFSLPGLFENKRILKIKEVDILFEKEPINFKNFFPKLKNWLNRTIKLLKK